MDARDLLAVTGKEPGRARLALQVVLLKRDNHPKNPSVKSMATPIFTFYSDQLTIDVETGIVTK